MAITTLSGDGKAQLPAGRLTLLLEVEGSPEVRLDVHRIVQETPGAEVEVIRPRTGIVLIPKVDGPMRVVANHTTDGVFADPTVLQVSVISGNPDSYDSERVVVSGVNVAGLRGMDLLELRAEGSRIGARLPPAPREEDDLSPLSSAARVAARHVLGGRVLPDAQTVEVVVAIDTSASMRRHHQAGSVAAMMDVLVGICQVIARRPVPRALLVDQRAHPVNATTVAQLARLVSEQAEAHGSSVGFRAADANLSGLFGTEPTVVYRVTDSIPADVDRLDDRTGGEIPHLIIIADQSYQRLVEPPPVRCTFLPPGQDDYPLAERLLTDTAETLALVKSLVSGVAERTERARA